MSEESLTTLFTERAHSAGAQTFFADSVSALVERLIAACIEKSPCEVLSREETESDSFGPVSLNGVPTRTERVLAAPGLPAAWQSALADACKDRNIRLVTSGLRAWIAGLDVGVNVACAGVAESGTCVVDTLDEDVRLAGMIAETGVILLPEPAILNSLPDIAPVLRQLQTGRGYASCITGPSRTADIERVPAVGVHGPLALHVIILRGELLFAGAGNHKDAATGKKIGAGAVA